MNNLLNNAIKFTTGNGNIHVSISILKEATRENNYFQISVSDTGIGIPENQLHKIFEKFSQVDNTATRNFGGTGHHRSIGEHCCAECVGPG